MKVYCKKLEIGEWLQIPPEWKVQIPECEMTELGSTFLVVMKDLKDPETVEEMCNWFFESNQELDRNKIWLVFYYPSNFSFFAVVAEENYLLGTKHEMIEVIT